MPMKLTTIIALAALTCSQAVAGRLYICAEHGGPEDWEDEFSRGPVAIPAGTVFDYAGHILGSLQDPKDSKHYNDTPSATWKVSKEENDRRSKLIMEDLSTDQKHTSGVVTTKEVRLTKSKPCAETSAAVVLSDQWGWTVAPIFGDSSLYYGAYGVIRQGQLDTGFNDDENPLDHLAARGQLNACIRGTISQIIHLRD
jgi:hypothetical protein